MTSEGPVTQGGRYSRGHGGGKPGRPEEDASDGTFRIAGVLMLIALVCIVVVLGSKCLFDDHRRFVAFDVRLLWIASAAGIAWFFASSRLAPGSGRTLPALILLVSVVLAVGIFVTRELNMLLTYDEWMGRGGPRPWHRGCDAVYDAREHEGSGFPTGPEYEEMPGGH